MLGTYHIPDLVARCPRRPHLVNNGKLTKLEEEHNQWVDSFPLFGDVQCARCKGEQMPLFASCCYPTADVEALHAVVAVTTALICLDHAKYTFFVLLAATYDVHTRSSDTASVEEAEETAKLWISAFNDQSAGLESSNGFVKLISGLASRATAVVGDAYKADCRRATIAFARATVQEAVDRQTAEAHKVKLTFDTYMPTRRNSVACPVFLVYVRAINGLEVSPDPPG
ncbi:hypothetical protein EDC04DRAFT_2614470 [Pisolithus marmoratus]|nr:hypothetical protein EDC04DRAFT_2614470 [Pisolithus marmoratus]